MQTLKRITAGPLRREALYPKITRQERRQRGPRVRMTDAAKARLNLKYKYERLEELLAANFLGGFWWVTVTYRDQDLPGSRDEAQKLLAQKYIRKLRTHWRRHGTELKYIYCTQEVQSDGSRRLHHHMVLNRCGKDDFDTIKSLWTWCDEIGIDIKWLRGMQQCTDKAHYMTHETRDHGKQEAGKKDYVTSRNLQKPVEETYDVPDGLTLEPPYGAQVLDSDMQRNEHGAFAYLKYVLGPPGRSDVFLALGEGLTFGQGPDKVAIHVDRQRGVW